MSGNGAIEYGFESTGLSGIALHVLHVRVVEALSEPFVAEIHVAAADLDADVAELLGKDGTLTMTRAGIERRVCGVIAEVQPAERVRGTDHPTALLVVTPALHLLALRRNTRMFQEKTVPEILEDVLGEALGPYSRSAQLDLTRTYDPREYCLQYAETDLDFVHRLMEEEGIAYRFDHSGDVEVMVLTDASSAFEAAPTLSGDGSVRYEPHNLEGRGTEGILDFTPGWHHTTTAIAIADFDWTKAGHHVREAAEGEDANGRVRESYEHGGGRELRIGSYDEGVRRYQKQDGAAQAPIRREAAIWSERLSRGVGRAVGLAPGSKLTLAEHPSVDANIEYLLVRVVHVSSQVTGQPDSEPYQNRFECIPAETVFRPQRRTPKPLIDGIQTAVVTGPSGEEIHVDAHGRIKVQFHWDRENPADETSSCWIRVKQEWAGAGWGFWWVPRIGMEVIVHFIDGDPDRPLVTGSVYDGTNSLPYPLPDEKTKSTIKSNSSLGGGGFNELRFEDKAGSEEIYTHAQKDYNEVVENDHNTLVHNDQTNTVDNNQTQEIGGNQTENVDANQTMTVGGNRTVHVKGNYDETIDGTETRKVAGDVTETFDASETRSVSGNLDETIGGNETRTVMASLSETVSGSHTQSITGGSTVTIAAALTQTVTGGLNVTTPAAYTASAAGGWKVTAAAGITILAAAGVKLVAPGGAGRVDYAWDLTTGAKAEDVAAIVGELWALKTEACLGLAVYGGVLKVDIAGNAVGKTIAELRQEALEAKMEAIANDTHGLENKQEQTLKA